MYMEWALHARLGLLVTGRNEGDSTALHTRLPLQRSYTKATRVTGEVAKTLAMSLTFVASREDLDVHAPPGTQL